VGGQQLNMIVATQYRRLYWLAFLLSIALATLGGRLVDLQVVRHDEFRALAETNTVRVIECQPMRGQILDIRGNPLAASLPAKTVCANPSLLWNRREAVAQALAPLLDVDECSLAARLAPRLVQVNGKVVTNQYVVLKNKVPLETWDIIQQTMSRLSFGAEDSKLNRDQRAIDRNIRNAAIFAEDDQIRVYPNQRLAGHVLGFVANDSQEKGLSGIELAFNTDLSGIPGWRRTEMDKHQRELVRFRDQDVEARDGLNVYLTIDAGLQNIVESELAAAMEKHSPVSVTCIMVRPRTGEILAMATLPNFDPNMPGHSTMDALRNRAISDTAEPGSTFKIVVVTAGLDKHVVTLNDVFNCENGHFAFAGRVLHDHEPFGMLTVENIITKSSNIGAAKIGIELGQENLFDYIQKFGFGARTGIPLPGEVGGIVHPLKDWSKVSIAQIPMGQGVAVTPIQMVMAMCAIANNGLLMRPMLVDRLEDENGRVMMKYSPQPVRQVADLETIHEMVTALKTVVTGDGTAVGAALDHYTVAGKTGTAQKVEHGVYVQKFFSSFIGFFPADDPQLCISVVMDDPKEGHFGGKIAAPVFHNIAERAANYLNLKPDIGPAPQPFASPVLTADAAPDTVAEVVKK
jgi:cell division protein FtsI/penicillin-binding protein 2